jgi:tetratricopeptide (TPR) repeat protein
MAVEELISKLFTLANSSSQRARAELAKGDWLRLAGRFDEVTEVLHHALEEATAAQDTGLEALVLERISASLWEQGKSNEMLEFLSQAQIKAQLSQQPEVMLLTERMLFVVHQSKGDWVSAEPHYQRSLELAEEIGDYNSLALLLGRASLHQIAVGDGAATLKLAEQAWQLHQDHQGSGEYHQLAALVLWAAHMMRGAPLEAIRPLQLVIHEYENQSYNITGVVHATLSASYGYLGRLEQAALHFQRAQQWPGYPPFARHMLHMAEATLVQHACLPMPEKIAPYEGLALPEMSIALVSWAKVLPPDQALPLLRYLLELNTYKLPASLIETHTRLAQKLLELEREEEALETIQDDLETVKTTQTIIVDPAEVHYTHYCVLQRFRTPEALESLRAAHAWVLKVANSLPEEDKQIFLSINPVSRAILGAVTQHGLE